MEIPKQLQNKEFRFVKLGLWNEWARYGKDQNRRPKIIEKKIINPENISLIDKKIWKPLGKAPFEVAWQSEKNYCFDDPSLIQHINKGRNFGIIGGYGKLVVLDIDKKELGEELEKQLDTFTIKTGSGGKHFYFLVKGITSLANEVFGDKGELRLKNYQVVSCPCRHPTGNYYEIVKDIKIKEVSSEYIEDLVKPLRENTELKNNKELETKETDRTRSAKEYGKVIEAIRKGMNKEQVFKEMEIYSKWASSPEAYQELTYKKALAIVDKEKPTKPKETPVRVDDLDIKTIMDYVKLKINKNYIVQDFLHPETLTMLYSPPAMFKSLTVMDMALSISKGIDFMGLKTKKHNVLYCDGENADIIIKERLVKFCKGKRMKRRPNNFYILKNALLMDEKKNVHLGVLMALENAIEKYKIKVVVFDTLHRFAYYDENRADDINMLYTKVFKHLINNFGVTILFLHHSKKDGGYRGSGDFLGMVDVSYKVLRTGKTNKFRIINEKCRSGEIADISGEINFGEEFMRIDRLDEEVEQEEKINKLKELTDRVRTNCPLGIEVTNKDIETQLEMQEYEYSKATLKRVLKWLVDNEVFDKTEKGVYRRVKE